MRDYIIFYLNGEKRTVKGEKVFLTLSEYLRYDQNLTGTKVVCAEGDCGACTVLAARIRPCGENKPAQFEFQTLNSCINFLFLMDGCHIVTVEGLKENGELHPVQKAVRDHYGAQCGFCTPGFVASITGFFEDKKEATHADIKKHCSGNLCRCTGYKPILEAALSVNPQTVTTLRERYYDSGQVGELLEHVKIPVSIRSEGRSFHAPLTFEEALRLRKVYGDLKVFSGATDLGVQVNKGKLEAANILSLNLIPELYGIGSDGGFINIGAKATLSEAEKYFEDRIPEISSLLNLFASPQIRNVGTVSGNVANASPIGDMIPALLALDAQVHLESKDGGGRIVKLDKFFLGYRKTDLGDDEIIRQVSIPHPKQGAIFKIYKVSKRKDLDISTLSAAFYLEMNNTVISRARIAYGGVSPYARRIYSAENHAVGRKFDMDLMKELSDIIGGEVTPISDMRALSSYRRRVSGNLLFKFYQETH
ncbi:MAG: FAD binding domain-containing protein [Oligoflexales bacterium]|nr:FAD binding domain-containing protein [Oligoflexales bacterium]